MGDGVEWSSQTQNISSGRVQRYQSSDFMISSSYLYRPCDFPPVVRFVFINPANTYSDVYFKSFLQTLMKALVLPTLHLLSLSLFQHQNDPNPDRCLQPMVAKTTSF